MEEKNIFDAAYKGNFEYIHIKLENSPELLQETDSSQRTIFHWAVLSGNLKLVSFLVELGADLNAEDDNGSVPVILASSAGHKDIAKLLIERCVDLNHQNAQGHSALQYAASKGWYEICEMLIKNGANVNITDERGSTPLHRAASKGNNRVVELLLEQKDLHINQKDRYGNTPLHLACEDGQEDTAVILVKAGANIEEINKDSLTPLDLCSFKLARALKKIAEENS